ncbi:meckelin isoform X2 [Schistocerca americana]|uniref:meckelin isoform X2 n=1 Tax=Schistocerca americana TaxID=7009 RepID=UPI001F4F46A1|nr:meckelin isoform X2 [Schistocerca americana]
MVKLLYYLILILCWTTRINTFSGETLTYSDPLLCNENEYFNSVLLKCLPCDSSRHLVREENGLTCACTARARIVPSEFADFPKCELCGENELPSTDRTACLPCRDRTSKENNVTNCEPCLPGHVRVERELNGNYSDLHCVKCAKGTVPSVSGKNCVPCSNKPSVLGQRPCNCTGKNWHLSGDMCIPSSLFLDWPEEESVFTVRYASDNKVVSSYIKMNLHRAVYLCKLHNVSSCQMLANMCAMLLYDNNYKGSPCKLFEDRKLEHEWKDNVMPWLLYGEGDAPAVLFRKKISAEFNLQPNTERNTINLTAVRFTPDGWLKEISKAKGNFLQLCPTVSGDTSSLFQFGARYHHSCTMHVSEMVAHRDTEFVELYLQYWTEGESVLYPIPVLILNMKARNANNKAADSSQWLLVRRFYFIDKISGIGINVREKSQLFSEVPSVIRYVKFCKLRVKLQGSEGGGRIYPPLLVIDYGEITEEEIKKDIKVSVSFMIEYEMDSRFAHSVEVAVGILSALAIVWSGIETWSYSRRSGRVGIDLLSLVQLALFSCGNLANVFFLVAASASVYTFVFYKGQSVVQVLLPAPAHEDLIKNYMISSLVLKVAEITHLIGKQISVDIFLIDWERPRARSTVWHRNKKSDAENSEQPVSVWRTYFIANEWNEIQTKRKTSLVFQLSVTLLFLKVIGLENWALSNPNLHSSILESTMGNPPCVMFRFAIGVTVYLVIYVLQWLFATTIYERYIKNAVQEFVDLCSMANISVFILASENYGFYVHGRSPHGFADTDMYCMINHLQREEEDLCSRRGLVPGTDQQTFQMTVPPQLRAYYNKVMSTVSPVIQPNKRLSAAAAGLRTKMPIGNTERIVQAYQNLNKFLSAFLDHALKDLDYEIRDKLFVEALLDIEFAENSDKGVLYTDNGHSFDGLLFSGYEFTLAGFELIIFSSMDLLCQDFLLSAVITICIVQVVIIIRTTGGRRNLTRKTLIDDRFLI